MRLGIFGGSFDPVHYGHLLVAETCCQQRKLDRVVFVPAAVPPHKQQWQLTSARQRLEMLELAIAGNERFEVSTIEVERGGVSYSVDTLSALAEEHPQATLFFLMGADSLCDLPTWREPQRLCQLAIPLVACRADTPEPDLSTLARLVDEDRLGEIRRHQVTMPIVEFSSTDLRRRVAAGESIRYRTPRAVQKYIETHGLYRQQES